MFNLLAHLVASGWGDWRDTLARRNADSRLRDVSLTMAIGIGKEESGLRFRPDRSADASATSKCYVGTLVSLSRWLCKVNSAKSFLNKPFGRLGHRISRGTVANILREHGIEPAPERGPRTAWRTFLQAHWEMLAAADFFTVEVSTWTGLVTYYVLIVMELSSRRVYLGGVTPHSDHAFMMQVARNLKDSEDGFLLGKRFLILDRDQKYSKEFRHLLENDGTDRVRLPVRSPNFNAFAERFVLSIKTECLDRMILFGEASLRRAVNQYLAHYQRERNHQGLGNRLIEPKTSLSGNGGKLACRERLGGMLKYYYRAAA